MGKLLEIEIDGPQNDCLQFRPLQRVLRGRFDWHRVGEPEAHRHATKWGSVPIPGKVIGFDEDAGGYIREQLHDPKHAALAEKVKARGFKLEEAREEFKGTDRNTWLFWMKQAVEAGIARIVAGEFPSDIDPETARKDFIFAPPKPTAQDRAAAMLTEALLMQAKSFNRLADVLEKSLLKK